jgi:DNA polymerase-3 subunit alpha
VELVNQCKAAWKERIDSEFMGYKPDRAKLQEYIDRLKMELNVLKTLGFCNYFLLVADLVRWAKANDIIVGPGRGSVGGSLVAFVLGITDVDPIRFNLLFERFINPERLDLPDADLDFMSARRHEVVEYLRDKYGRDCVAQISNYNTLAAPSALRETGRFFELPDRDYACTSYIPKEHGQSKSLEEALEEMPELQQFADKYPHQFKIAQQLQGQLRSMGTHAAGVIVAAEPVENRAVVDRRGGDGAVNWDKRVVEDMGLVKIDILGLTNLDVIGRARAKILHDYGKDVDLLKLPLDDPKVLKAFGLGDTIGVFQFEGGGMRKLLKDLAKGGDLTFEELSAATALFRPGPIDSGLLDDYVAIRQGAAMESYEHPNMKAALAPTFGVIVYQEQVMQLARDLAGFTLAGADHLRKAMGKKDPIKMAEQRDNWVQGCKNHSGIEEAWSNALFDKIELFAGYAFNRSHSVEYAIISYWTMWLKVYYPHAFYAAALEVFKEDKLHSLVADAAKRGIEILPPDINQSTSEFRRFGDHLMAPLNRVKGVGEPTEKAILDARAANGGSFKTVDELIEKVERRKCNVRHRAILEEVGAFASIIPGSLPPRHPDRVKRQLELLPGLIAANVRAERNIVLDGHIKDELTKLYMELRDEGAIVLPRFGKKPKIVVVFEAPTVWDEKSGKLMETDSSQPVKDAIKAAGLSLADCYITTYLKRPKAGKQPDNSEILFSKPYFEREMELLKPPVILALGSFVARELLPDERGGIMELSGKVVYSKARDASVVVSISPGMIYHDPGKQTLLNDAVARAAELFS